jgi:hypothetical protein
MTEKRFILMKNLIFVLILVISGVLIAGCTVPNPCIEGSGLVITDSRSPGDFSRIDLVIPAELVIRQEDTPSLTISADENILPLITTTINNGKLTIAYTQPCIRPSQPITIQATAPEIKGLAILGSGDIRSTGTLVTDTLDTGITGTGSINLDVQTSMLTSTITGTGTEAIRGHAMSHQIQIPGAGRVEALSLETRNTSINIIGSGSAEVQANSALSITIIGSGSVVYSGNPADIQQSITGTGDIQHI